MKKIFLVLLAAAMVFSFAFTGCGDKDNTEDTNPGDQKTTEKNVLKVTSVEEWNGIDLLHSAINFTVGDSVYVKGSTNSSSFCLNGEPGGLHDINYPHIEKGDFEKTKILTDEDVGYITAEQDNSAPKGIRVQGKQAKSWFIIEELTVTRGETEVFNFSNEIKDEEPGEITVDTFNNLSRFWQSCGDPKYEIF